MNTPPKGSFLERICPRIFSSHSKKDNNQGSSGEAPPPYTSLDSDGENKAHYPEEDPDHPWCSYCQTTHDKANFSPAQGLAHPSSRQCLGATGLFRLCEHHNYKLQDLRSWYLRGGQELQCQQEPTSTQCKLGFSEGGVATSELQYRLIDLSPSERLTEDHLRLGMLDLDQHAFCPHIHPTDAWVPERLFAAEMLGKPTLICQNRHCHTTVLLLCKVAQDPPFARSYDLCVIRRLGRLEKATDRRWVAQLVRYRLIGAEWDSPEY